MNSQGNSEIHVVEYKQDLGSVICQQIYETPDWVEKVIFDDKKTKNIISLTHTDNGHTIINYLNRDSIKISDVESREDCFKINKDARGSKKGFEEMTS
jgi:hypothetical protein